jgi:hypothetical protein
VNKRLAISVSLAVIVLCIGFATVAVCLAAPKAALLYKFYTVGRNEVDPRLQSIVTDMQLDLSATRPSHNQQLDLDEINEGDILIEVHETESFTILVTRAPYEDQGKCRFEYVWLDFASKFIQKGYCSDFGLVEYNGPLYGWNPINYLKSANKDPLSASQIQDILKDRKPAP